MEFKNSIRRRLSYDGFAAFILLIIFLIIKGYKFGWDDQHLEIPLLKSLIDKALYNGDYYVGSLKVNFLSYFYPLLARIITVSQIPAAYVTLYLLSKYFLFYWVYKLWRHISQERSVAFICTLVFMSFGRTPEFLYRTFSHQEFSLAIIFAGIYFFFKERFVLASAILGLASNFHFLYSLFPMSYVSAYLLLEHRKHGWKALFKSAAVFGLAALPIIVWIMKKNFLVYLNNPSGEASPVPWITIYKLACPQNFIFYGITPRYMLTNFPTWLGIMMGYFFLCILYIFNTIHNEKLRNDKKIHATVFSVVFMLALSYYFTYIQPSRFILDLNLVRHTQFLFFFLMGYTAIFVTKLIDQEKTPFIFFIAFFFGLTILNDYVATASIAALTFLLFIKKSIYQPSTRFRLLTQWALCGGFLICLAILVKFLSRPDPIIRATPFVLFILLSSAYAFCHHPRWRQKITMAHRLFIIFPLLAVLIHHATYHYHYATEEKKAAGFWKLQRDWEDMQRYAQAHTPKSAIFLVPNDMEMGGFRIFSERTVICCYRDCGIVGFDYKASIEWLKRLGDIEQFKVILNPDSNITPAILKAIVLYKANYIVFMRYYAPKTGTINFLEKIYENDGFTLFKVLPNFFLKSSPS